MAVQVKDMSILDYTFLNPFEKWRLYGKPPWTFLAHACLCILVMAQALLLYNLDIPHLSHSLQHFDQLLTGGEELVDRFRSPEDLQDAFERTVHNFFSLNNFFRHFGIDCCCFVNKNFNFFYFNCSKTNISEYNCIFAGI